MAKLTAPLMSQDATGRCFGDMQITHWKGRHVIGRRRRPRQPRTEAQVATRRWMTFLNSRWSDLTAAEKATWPHAAGKTSLPAYHRFLQHNTNWFKHLHGYPTPAHIDEYMPAATWPPPRAAAPATRGATTKADGPGWCTVNTDITWVGDGWLILYHHVDPAVNTPTYQNFIGGQVIRQLGIHSSTFTGLPAGQYKVAFCIAGREGKARMPYAFINCYPT